ncbi:hypothetical protein H4R99_007147 [Coemansia sp. RSA 1722]|nr:hypothetical protein LPJ57_002777 [Coemansia sp. RSA 486]KAJ2225648.1 hypothetical protein IWW45_007783 [Coemansia sp. RSA 485]KAJ2590313.1 hypothetical protein H4R99_007147 [Coemansia sp. RSA 1722]KAJ2638053.1 hypothetical protein GGF40_001942 [Coemansia sp. RSA 1286]
MNNVKPTPDSLLAGQGTPGTHSKAISGTGGVKRRRRPPYSYTALIAQAILVSKNKQLTLREIYNSIDSMYPQICQGPDVGWQNTIRHNLSLNLCFKRIPRSQLSPSESLKLRGKGSYWTVDVELMDPNTRKRLEEAIAKGKPAIILTEPIDGASHRVARKKSKPFHSESRSSPVASAKCASSDLVILDNGVVNQSFPQSANSSPYSLYSREEIQYVSPAIQSSSPYFQSSMNSPISSMPTVAAKHMSSPISRGHLSRTGVELPPLLPPMAPTMPSNLASGGRYYSHRIVSSRSESGSASAEHRSESRVSPIVAWDSVSDSPPPLDDGQVSAMPCPSLHGSFGTAVHYARSTARMSTFCGLPQNSRTRSTLENHPSSALTVPARPSQLSPYSLSPASTVMPLNETGSVQECKHISESAKLSISHLLN